MKYNRLNHNGRLLSAGLLLLFSLVNRVLVVQVPVNAISTDVVIARVQTGGAGSGTASQELISLYNTSAQDVNVTGWCVEYSSGANGQNFSKLSCLQSGYEQVGLWLPAGGWVSFGTLQFFEVTALPVDFYFTAGLAGAAGHVRLVNSNSVEVDRVGWGTAVLAEGTPAVLHAGGQILSRDITSNTVDTDNNFVDFQSRALTNFVPGDIYEQEIEVDICVNIDGVQLVVPAGLEYDESTAYCEEPVVLENAPIQVTELYPDAQSYDTGQEFIELYNPTDRTVNLEGYTVAIGPSYTQSSTLSSGIIAPGGYVAISDLQSGVTLPNSSGSVRLSAPDGTVVSESAVYYAPTEFVSWSLIDGVWQYSNQITPGLVNVPYQEELDDDAGVSGGVSGARVTNCPLGKVRNPATNRCRTVGSTQAQLLACEDDEYRSVETNRCRKLVTVSGSLVACKEGQVRNPATNRCKSVTAGVSQLTPCKEGQVRNPDTNRCRKLTDSLGIASDGGLSEVSDVAVPRTSGGYILIVLVLVLLAVFGYMIYEWRDELMRCVYKMKLKRRFSVAKISENFFVRNS